MNSTETTPDKAALFLKRLREATSPLHLALEANTLMSSLTDPGLSIRNYQAYLTLMSRVISYFETSIQSGAVDLLGGWLPHHSSSLINADLEAVEQISGEQIAANDFKPAQPITSANASLGFLYVMEGSKLGGRVIFKQVKRHLGLDELNGARYLANSGADTLVSWKQFLEAFSSYIAEHNGEEQAIAGANLAFLSIAAFFESNKDLYEF